MARIYVLHGSDGSTRYARTAQAVYAAVSRLQAEYGTKQLAPVQHGNEYRLTTDTGRVVLRIVPEKVEG